jgi:xyloglucan-specific exo-beta-1,4-glucanase
MGSGLLTLRKCSTLLLLVSLAPSCVRPPASSSALEHTPEGSSSNVASTTGVTPYVWKNVPILGGGFVTGVIFSEQERDLVYARTDIGGAYRWEPAGKRWAPITDWLGRADANYMGIESLALHPSDPDKVFLAAGTYVQDWAGNGAMLRSSDRGRSWQVTPMPIKMGGNETGRSNGERLAVDPSANDIVYFGSRKDGLWRSRDGAVTWQRVETFPSVPGDNGTGIPIVLFPPGTPKNGAPAPLIYAAVSSPQQSLFRSQDAGASWEPLAGQPKGKVPSHMSFDASGVLYVAYGNVPGPSDVTDGAVFKYSPESGRWQDITPLAPSADDKFGYGGLAVDPRRPGHLLVCTIDRWTRTDEIFRSTDAGKSWSAVGQRGQWHSEGALYLHHGKAKIGITHWTGDIDIDPFDSARATVVGGTGVFMTENLDRADRGQPVDFRFTNRGLEETAVLSLVSPPSGPPLLSGVGDICGFRHDDLDAPPARGAYSAPSCNGTTSIDYAEKAASFVARVGRVWGREPHGAYSRDGGATWSAFLEEPEGSQQGGAIAVSSDGRTLLWSLKGFTPTVSRDGGASWTAVQGVRAASRLPDWTNMDLQPAADRVEPRTFYVYDAQHGAFYVSHDAAATFVRSYGGLPALADYQLSAASISAVPGAEGHVWITTGKELYRSMDAGRSFVVLSSVQESYGLGLGKAAPGREYPALYLSGKVGDTQGFFRSDDGAQSWLRINDDAHQFGNVNIIRGDPRVHGRVYLGSAGRGVLYGMPGSLQ